MLTPPKDGALLPPPKDGAAFPPKGVAVELPPPNDGAAVLPAPNEGTALAPKEGAPPPPKEGTAPLPKDAVALLTLVCELLADPAKADAAAAGLDADWLANAEKPGTEVASPVTEGATAKGTGVTAALDKVAPDETNGLEAAPPNENTGAAADALEPAAAAGADGAANGLLIPAVVEGSTGDSGALAGAGW